MMNALESVPPTEVAVGGLVHRRIFKVPPLGLVPQSFQKHVADTGSPETFDQISTSRPPGVGRLQVLTKFEVSRGRRPKGDLAPCPICSPHDPKYLAGLLVWCEVSSAIYAIGMECGATLWKDGRLDQAFHEFTRAAQRRDLENDLLDRIPSVPRLRAWVAENMETAAAADRLCRSFKAKAPTIYALVREAFSRDGGLYISDRGGDQAKARLVARIEGQAILQKSFRAEHRLTQLDQRLGFLDFGEDELECVEAVGRMTTLEQAKARKWLMAAEIEVARTYDYLSSVCDFFADENFAALRRWSEADGSPYRLFAVASSGRFKIYIYNRQADDWFDRIDDLMHPRMPPRLT